MILKNMENLQKLHHFKLDKTQLNITYKLYLQKLRHFTTEKIGSVSIYILTHPYINMSCELGLSFHQSMTSRKFIFQKTLQCNNKIQVFDPVLQAYCLVGLKTYPWDLQTHAGIRLVLFVPMTPPLSAGPCGAGTSNTVAEQTRQVPRWSSAAQKSQNCL